MSNDFDGWADFGNGGDDTTTCDSRHRGVGKFFGEFSSLIESSQRERAIKEFNRINNLYKNK